MREFPVMLLAAALVAGAAARAGARPRATSVLLGAIVALTLGISMVPHPVHVTYATVVAPVAAVLLGVAGATALARAGYRRPGRLAAAALALALLAGGVAATRCDPGELARVRKAARDIGRAVPGGAILTFQNTLTAEMGRDVPARFEMGPFAFWPHVSNEEAARRKVVNAERLCESIEYGSAAVVVISRMELRALLLPCGRGQIGDALARDYTEMPALRVSNYGQYGAPEHGGDGLFVFVRRR
jgi:hypothetical protein